MPGHLILLHAAFALGLLSLTAAPAAGRTWTVAKDGSGDFEVIQEAVDAASSGDVIEIGPGRYPEFQTVQGGVFYYDFHVYLPEDIALTFTGAGSDETIIGPDDPDAHENFSYGIVSSGSADVTVRDLAIENCNEIALQIPSGSLVAERCRFFWGGSHADWCMGVDVSASTVVRDCRFEGVRYGLYSTTSPGGVLVESCEFVNVRAGVTGWTGASSDIEIANCSFSGGVIGVSFLTGGGGAIRESQFTDCMISLSGSGAVTIEDCIVSCPDGDHALSLGNPVPVTITNSIFESTGDVVRCSSYGGGYIRDNHFLRLGEGRWIYSPNHSGDPHDIDFSGNYWGTTDVAEIAAGIWDCHDHGEAVNCVNFEPIAGGPVPTETRSWSAVKGLFRGK